ncbi:MAG TPA: ester cyclase [Rubrobacter sp.]|nr:ester cyclase [Rubrobacter sp.]
MSEEVQNKVLMRRFYEELWSRGNLEAIPELVAEDFVDHQAPVGQPSGRGGLAGLAVMWRTGFPDMQETVEDLISEGDKVMGRFLMRGTHGGELMGVAPTGRSVTMGGIDVVRIADGKISEFWYAEQMLELMQQLGAAPVLAADRTEGGW